MKFGSVCSGIEAASVAWEPLGWKAAWFSEIEPFPSAVLKHHYPKVPNLGDMTTLPDRILSGEVEAPDLFCGGTPCQAFSVAGLRKSLDDARGNLSLTFCEIANAIDTTRARVGLPPTIIFWENVPGVLSTKDNAFGCFLAGLVGEDDPIFPAGGKWTNAGAVLGPQRAAAWRVLDAQYFGVAQRRRRVFVVAGARNGFDPAAVLFEWDSLRRDIAPSREAGERPAGTIAARFGTSRNNFEELAPPEYLGNAEGGAREVPFLTCHNTGGTAGISNQTPLVGVSAISVGLISKCLNAKEGGGRMDAESETLIPTTGGVFDVAGCEFGPSGGKFVDVNPTLDARAKDGPIRNQLAGAVLQSVTHTLRGEGFDASEYGTGRPGDPCHTLARANAEHAVVVGFDAYNNSVTGEVAKTLDVGQDHHHVPIAYSAPMAVRRLTPVECERLQGFPDGFTNIPWRGKPESPDGPRYKALGNSWAVPVVRWIGRRIQLAVSI